MTNFILFYLEYMYRYWEQN